MGFRQGQGNYRIQREARTPEMRPNLLFLANTEWPRSEAVLLKYSLVFHCKMSLPSTASLSLPRLTNIYSMLQFNPLHELKGLSFLSPNHSVSQQALISNTDQNKMFSLIKEHGFKVCHTWAITLILVSQWHGLSGHQRKVPIKCSMEPGQHPTAPAPYSL